MDLPWYLVAIAAFCAGVTFERFVLDRKYLHYVKRMQATIEQLHADRNKD